MYTYENVFKTCLEYFNGDELATSTLINKYLMQDQENNYIEHSPEDLFNRLTSEFYRIEQNYPNPLSKNDIYELFKDFKYIIPGGSALFGVGNNQQITSIANCFVIEQPEDNYNSIVNKDKELVHLMKRRGGVGIDISKLRPAGTPINNAAMFSDGVTCFMNRYSNTTKEVAQNGRRGALMITLDCRHPDLENFITVKQDLTKVTGANISVKWHDDFLNCVENDEEYTLRFPVDSSIEEAKVTKVVKAKEIWDKFVNANWNSAEPGCLYWDRVITKSLSDCYDNHKTVSTNPCVVGSTIINTRQFGKITMKELVELFNKNNYIEVMSFNTQSNNYEFKEVTNAMLTKKDATVIKIGSNVVGNIDNPLIVCTPDHKIYTKTNGYVEAGDLQLDDIIQGNEIWVEYTDLCQQVTDNEDVYDITVKNNNNFIANNIVVHNCGEITLSPYSSCILMAINLTSFVENQFQNNATFNFDKFADIVYKANKLIDDMIDLELEKIEKIMSVIKNGDSCQKDKDDELFVWGKMKEKYIEGRRTGLGILGYGDMLAMLGITYGSEDALKFTEKLFSNYHKYLMKSQSILAQDRGMFPIFEFNKEKDNFYYKGLDNKIIADIKRNGRRNISFSTIAPTGSISMLAQITSGIEPVFMRSYKRRRKLNTSEIEQGVKPDHIDDDGIKWIIYDVFHHKLKEWLKLFPNKSVEESPYYEAEASEINWESRVKLQSIAQKYITHSISSTVNLPKDISVSEVHDIYINAWKYGCKGITVYRESCREGVLFVDDEIEDAVSKERPKLIPCDIHYSTIEGHPWIIFIGMFNGKPYEVIGGKKSNVEIPKKYKNGWIKKNGIINGRRTYELVLGSLDDENEQMVIKDICHIFSTDASSYTRHISLSLRYNVPINVICETLHKDGDSDMFSFAKGIARCLKKYITDGTSTKEDCPECSDQLKYKDGCVCCMSCGWSKCM